MIRIQNSMVSNKWHFKVIALIWFVISPSYGLGQTNTNYLKPIDISESIALVKATIDNACYIGLGRQHTTINISKQETEHQSSNDLFDFDAAPSLLFGCFLSKVELGFAINHASYKLNNEVTYQAKDYNSITYYQNTTSIGYLAHIWLKHFYVSSGVAYSNTRYQLGYFDSETGEDYSSAMKNDSQFMYYLKLIGVMTPSLFANLKYQQSFSNNHFIQNQLQLGINFYTSF